MKIGILVIGSLYWDGSHHRRNWRSERLDMGTHVRVRVPIRYGRRSQSRGYSYTMVFSPGLDEERFGHAIVIPCKLQDAVKEAEWLWAAESNRDTPNNRISANWGRVALLENPDRPIHPDLRHTWIKRISCEPRYAEAFNTPNGDEPPVDKSGFLTILWPTTLSRRPLQADLLIATATNPTIIAGDYPTPRHISNAWQTPIGRKNLHYFQNNRKNGIQTCQDEELQRLLGTAPVD